MRHILFIIWVLLSVWSLASLLFFRSSAGHGPDMVGEEVFGFALPLVIALIVAVGMLFGTPVFQLPTWSAIAATVTLAIIEVIIYSLFVVR